MNIYMILAFSIFALAFYISDRILKEVKFNLRRRVKSRFIRVFIILAVFAVAVYFNLGWRDTRDIISFTSLAYVFAYGITLKILIHFIWPKPEM